MQPRRDEAEGAQVQVEVQVRRKLGQGRARHSFRWRTPLACSQCAVIERPREAPQSRAAWGAPRRALYRSGSPLDFGEAKAGAPVNPPVNVKDPPAHLSSPATCTRPERRREESVRPFAVPPATVPSND